MEPSFTMLRMGEIVVGLEWEGLYRELLGDGNQLLMEGAMDVCHRLSKTHRMFVITNGITHTQIKRLKQSGLYKFFEDIFDSQSIGYQKPKEEFFNYVISHISEFNRKDALVIGDSLNTDIKGGLQSGIDTCWVNRTGQISPAEIKSTYTISNLMELTSIC
ncbi:haloacid dehalogenase [Paenibacillus jamilae]|uniref:Haloacid dehalogenase n=1 Tax=Paenibacillus jamilae TaxID=114136 RepID=A0ACC4ZX98_9BACL|nr:haloacid dehalogenase [Paenibacillus sp. lzh-N1]KTS83417.1 haloacid dehalogenase [Paenibacillus jamilae]MBE3650887.1 HAD-IA family hydrolase [Paenibacillus polymyxa]